jgi:hypothetical protein
MNRVADSSRTGRRRAQDRQQDREQRLQLHVWNLRVEPVFVDYVEETDDGGDAPRVAVELVGDAADRAAQLHERWAEDDFVKQVRQEFTDKSFFKSTTSM